MSILDALVEYAYQEMVKMGMPWYAKGALFGVGGT
jgi:hypothetical protein